MTETKTWPHHELGKQLSNWGRWGDDDEMGTLNFVTPEKRIAAAKLVRTGKIIDVGIPFDKNGPWPAAGFRINPVHVMTHMPSDSGAQDGMIAADDMVIMGLQSATQWDSLAHVGYDGYWYNGVPVGAVNNFVGASKNGFDKVVKGLISRGVLLDIAKLKGVDRLESSYQITSADLEAAEQRQGVRVESGDILMIRTGWQKWLAEGNKETYMGNPPGPVIDMCHFLHEREVAAMAIDQWTGECFPSSVEGGSIPFHQVAIRDMGLTMGEIFDFEELADDCEADGVWEGLFSGIGLKVTGAVGSPITPMVLK
jgi:kynurenine formamidase